MPVTTKVLPKSEASCELKPF